MLDTISYFQIIAIILGAMIVLPLFIVLIDEIIKTIQNIHSRVINQSTSGNPDDANNNKMRNPNLSPRHFHIDRHEDISKNA